jgi:hypothetical protein
MSIDTGQNLVFNANFPTPGIDQPSQQFRDNFQIIKTAVESLQAISSDSSSIITLTPTLSSIGSMTLDASYKNNALVLPIGDPSSGSPITGMVRYNTVTSCLEFYNGTAWCQTIYAVSGAVTLSNLTVTNGLTLGYTPTNPTDAASKAYVDSQILSLSSSIESGSGSSAASISALQTELDNETTNRQSADTNLQTQITAIDSALTNNSTQSNATAAQISSLSSGLAAEASARAAADTSQVNSINSLTTQVNQAVSLSNLTSSELTTEITNRENADQYLYNVINAGVTQSTLSNAISLEAAARMQGDSDNSNSIVTLANGLMTETARAEAAEADLANQIADANVGNVVLITGSTMTGDLVMNSAAIMMSNSAFDFDGGVSVQPVTVSNTNVYFDNTNVNIANGSSLSLSNSTLYLPKSNLILDSGQYFVLQSIPNDVGGGDSAYLVYQQNDFFYNRLTKAYAQTVAQDIIANGIANANINNELSCLRIVVTNDPSNGFQSDSLALEPSADLWMNPGWTGLDDLSVGGYNQVRTPYMPEASIYVGNACHNTVRIERATGNITTAGCIIINGNASNGQNPILFTQDSAALANANGVIANASIAPPPILANSYMQIAGADGGGSIVELVAYGYGTKYAGRSSGGTNEIPLATPAGHLLSSLAGFGYDGNTWTSGSGAAEIDLIANSAWTSINQETLLQIKLTPSGSTNSQVVLTLDGSGDLSVTGSITASGDVIGLSDVSLKSNVRTIPDALYTVNNLRGTLFTRDDLPGNPEQMGVIAQEVQKHVPQVVHNQNGLLGVSYGNLTALLIEAVKELSEKVKELSAEIDNLKNQ